MFENFINKRCEVTCVLSSTLEKLYVGSCVPSVICGTLIKEEEDFILVNGLEMVKNSRSIDKREVPIILNKKYISMIKICSE